MVGKESVPVPASTFETYKVEIKPADGSAGDQTLFVATDGSGRVVKALATVAEMGGAKMVSEPVK